ncbi:MAG: SEL1-like repeat protein [Victivallales bacterium]|nr:SEL1-like repeat protein [Victivallales bacterium]
MISKLSKGGCMLKHVFTLLVAVLSILPSIADEKAAEPKTGIVQLVPSDRIPVTIPPEWEIVFYDEMQWGEIALRISAKDRSFEIGLDFQDAEIGKDLFEIPKKMRSWLYKNMVDAWEKNSVERTQSKVFPLRRFAPSGRYGCAVRLTDKRFHGWWAATPPEGEEGEWKYVTVGICRAGEGTGLAFNLLTNSVDDEKYVELLEYIGSLMIPEPGEDGWKISDGAIAAKLAQEEFARRYPAEELLPQRPYSVMREQDKWIVTGNKWQDSPGGRVYLEIDGTTGEISKVTNDYMPKSKTSQDTQTAIPPETESRGDVADNKLPSPDEQQPIPLATPEITAEATLALDGDAETLLALGCRYKKGQGVPRDVKLAEKYLRAAGEKGSGKAWCELANLYGYASLVPNGVGEAISCYEKAVELGYPDGFAMLGECYLNAFGVHYDAEKAVVLFRKGVEGGSYYAMYGLGCCYLTGQGVEPDPQEAEKWFARAVELARKQAEQGDDVALANLGEWYLFGMGLPEDEKLARTYYEKAHDLGNLHATMCLAESYPYDEDDSKWRDVAIKLLQEMVDIGYPYAAMELFELRAGDSLTCGTMNQEQQEEFTRLVKRLEERGKQMDSYAYMELGFLFLEYIIAGDRKQAEAYYRMAAELGKPSAYYELGMMLRDNNPEEARDCLEKAASRGNKNALGELCIADGMALAMMNMDPKMKSNSFMRAVMGEKVELFLSTCALHLKRMEKYGMDTILREPWEPDMDFRFENVTFGEWMKNMRSAAAENPFVRKVLEYYDSMP